MTILHESQTSVLHSLKNIEEFSLNILPNVRYKLRCVEEIGIVPSRKEYWTYLYELLVMHRANTLCDSRSICAIETLKRLVSYHLLLLDDWIESNEMSYEEVKGHTRQLLNNEFDRLMIEVKGTYL